MIEGIAVAAIAEKNTAKKRFGWLIPAEPFCSIYSPRSVSLATVSMW